ncbi:CC0125/CC1285 family lipoprotein [Vibrio gallicus]|uniref:CC0125/CC1285 family lipoprotein n=1 Tax=Vibrio gallicus TaxID=190897 RepID=UPI0021C45B97|nr:hypothetical protein [Vibrio gallicus]
MRLLNNFSIVALLALLLSACATPYNTQKSFWTFGKGFTTTQIASDSWQISFVGNNYTDRAKVREYVMYKSAQLCHKAGLPYFTYTTEITNRDSVGQVGVANANNDLIIGTSSITKEGSSVVEVTGLKAIPSNPKHRIYDTEFILSHLNVKG